jgi:murein DD-endopeptidase MepM/ murein hydrolase activator NlpD
VDNINEWFAAAQEAATLGAQRATTTINTKIGYAQEDLDRLDQMLGNVDQVWSNWESQTLGAIQGTMNETIAAYGAYTRLLNEGFDEYEAQSRSRFAEYQETLKQQFGAYREITQGRFGELSERLPSFFQPVYQAVEQGNTEALEAVRVNRERAEADIATSLARASEGVSRALTAAEGFNPALRADLERDINSLGHQALLEVSSAGVHGARIEEATTLMAQTAARAEETSALRQIEEERMVAINEAARAEYQLKNASNAELDRILEKSGLDRQNALTQVQADLQERLLSLDEQARRARLEAEFGAGRMNWELSEDMRGLSRARNLLMLDRDSILFGELEGLAPYSILSMSQKEFALAFTHNSISEKLGLNEFERDWVNETVTKWFTDQEVVDGATFANLLAATSMPGSPNSPPPQHLQDALRNAVSWMNQGMDYWTKNEEAFQGVQRFTPPLASFPGLTAFGSFGATRDRGTGGTGSHAGIDLNMPAGTPIYSMGSGTIASKTVTEAGGYGMTIDHGGGWTTFYCHLPGHSHLEQGAQVSAGQPIAAVGTSGNAQVPHLHMEIRYQGQPVNPEMFFDLWGWR